MRVSESLAILRSFAAAFAKSYLWITYAGDAVILGFKPPYALDLASFASRAQEGDVAKDLKGVRLDDPLRLLAGLALEAGAVTEDPRILPVTDDRPYLEFRAARNVYIPHTVGENLAFFAGEVWPVADLLRNLGIPSSAAEPRLQTLLSANRAMMRAVAAVAASDPKAADLALEAWAAEPDGEQLAPLLEAPGLLARLAHPSTAVESLAAGAARARLTRRNAKSEAELARELAAALAILRRGLTLAGLDAPVERGLRRQIAVILGETRDYEGALETLRPLLEAPEPDPTILRIAARAEQRLGRDREAADLLARAAARDFRR